MPIIAPGVLNTETVLVSPGAPSACAGLASPKSITLASPRRVTMMLAGLMSRCRMPCECASVSASATWTAIESDLADVQWLPALSTLERFTVHVLHRNEEQAIGLSDFVDRADVGMVQGRGRPGFANKPGARVRVGRRLGGQQFERDVTAQLRIVGQVDFTHAAGPESRADLIATEPHAFADELHGVTGRES